MLEQAAQGGVPSRLAPHLEQAETVQHLLLPPTLQGSSQHFCRGGIKHSGGRALGIERAPLDGAPQYQEVLAPDTVSDRYPAKQEYKIHQAHATRAKFHPGGENEKSNAGYPVGHAPQEAINKRLDLAFHRWRHHGQVQQFRRRFIQRISQKTLAAFQEASSKEHR